MGRRGKTVNALPVALTATALAAWRFGLYRGLWRFASLPDLWNIIRAAALGAVIAGIILFLINRLEGIPRSVLILYPFFLDGVALNEALMQDDGIHPTEEAQAKLLDNVWPVIKPILQ